MLFLFCCLIFCYSRFVVGYDRSTYVYSWLEAFYSRSSNEKMSSAFLFIA